MTDLATRLLEAHRTGMKIGALADALVPPSEEAAFAVQADIVAALGERVIGRKVAVLPSGEGVGAPLVEGTNVPPGGVFPHVDVSIELEIAVRLGRDLPPPPIGRPYTRADIVDALDGVAVAFELVASRFADTKATPRRAMLADAMANAGVVVGPFRPMSAWPDLSTLTGRVAQEGTILFEGTVRHPAGDPLIPLLAYADRPAHALGPMRAGDVVITGALCGLLPITRRGRVTGDLAGLGMIDVMLS